MTGPARDADFDDLKEGESVSLTQVVTPDVLDRFGAVSGDLSPIHMSKKEAESMGLRDRVAHGALLLAWSSAIIGMRLPGKRAFIADIAMTFHKPVFAGDEVAIQARIERMSRAVRHLTISLSASVAGVVHAQGRVGVVVR
jgi:3-hydroxybutyryl-CoA dehydratase